MLKNLSKEFFFIFCYLTIGAMSYQGQLNPYPLGLLDTASVICLLIGVTFFFATLPSHPQLIVHLILLSVFLFITISSWFYFDYFQSLYTLSILSIGADMQAGTKALSWEPYGKIIILILSLSIGLTIAGARSRASSRKISIASGVIFLSLGVSGLIIVENSISQYKVRGIPWLHPANLHPLHALFKNERPSKQDTNNHRVAYEYFVNQNQPRERSNQNIIDGNQLPIENTQQKSRTNLIIILLESFRADFSGSYAKNGPSITPNFDRIAEQSITGKNYYSNTTYTISAELSIWCGIFDSLGSEKISYQNNTYLNLRCLPHLLADQGYQSHYFHGNSAQFYNRTSFIPKMGFDNSYFHKDQSAQPSNDNGKKFTNIGWGINDEDMFSIMLDQLEKIENKDPFFAHITTLSNHYPFSWQLPIDTEQLPNPRPAAKNALIENYQNTVYYTDYALGKFWDRFEKSPLYNNTAVIIASDHGIWLFDESQPLNLLEKNEAFYRSPLAIYHPDLKQTKSVTSIASHIDLLPTILELLDYKPETGKYMGKSLLNDLGEKKSWAIMNKGVDHILRKEDYVCYYNIDQCQTNQQDCDGWRGDIISNNKTQPLIMCQTISGNLLEEYSLTEKFGAEEEFLKAKLAIEYQN